MPFLFFFRFQVIITYFRIGRGLTSFFTKVVDNLEERSLNKAQEVEFWDRVRKGVEVGGGMLETSLKAMIEK